MTHFLKGSVMTYCWLLGLFNKGLTQQREGKSSEKGTALELETSDPDFFVFLCSREKKTIGGGEMEESSLLAEN